MIYSSKTPRDLNRDPFPFVTYRDVTGSKGPQPLWRSANKVDGAGFFAQREPRPEYDHVQHNEPNPILADYRMDIAHTTWRDRNPLEWLAEVTGPMVWLNGKHPWSRDQVNHASRVLARLANFTNGE
jgi:hypothetical protein